MWLLLFLLTPKNVGDSMENIVWINGNYEEDNRIFDSKRQAEEWADALFPDFGPYLISKMNVGYASL
jgi:hypothetical protein